MTKNFWWATAFATLNCVDALVTRYAIAHGHTELNPVMKALIAYSPDVFVWVKILVGLGVAWMFCDQDASTPKQARVGFWTVKACTIALALVVAWNFYVLLVR